jgi:hypothetical protein
VNILVLLTQICEIHHVTNIYSLVVHSHFLRNKYNYPRVGIKHISYKRGTLEANKQSLRASNTTFDSRKIAERLFPDGTLSLRIAFHYVMSKVMQCNARTMIRSEVLSMWLCNWNSILTANLATCIQFWADEIVARSVAWFQGCQLVDLLGDAFLDYISCMFTHKRLVSQKWLI